MLSQIPGFLHGGACLYSPFQTSVVISSWRRACFTFNDDDASLAASNLLPAALVRQLKLFQHRFRPPRLRSFDYTLALRGLDGEMMRFCLETSPRLRGARDG